MDSSQTDARLSAIEARLAAIETHLNISDDDFVDKFETTTGSSPTSTLSAVRKTFDEPVEDRPKPGNWLGIISVICFVLAAGFIIKLSIESGWLTPARQVGLAALFGFGLVGSGLALLNSDRSYASYLPGAGAVVLYTCAFASHRYYILIPFESALGLTALISMMCVWLYTKIEHDIYALTSAIGAYLAPLLLGMHAEAPFTLYYFAVCSLAFATLSVWVQSRTFALASSYLAIIATGFVGVSLGHDSMVAIFLGLHFVIFACGTYFYAYQTGRVLERQESWCFLPVLLMFYAMEYYFIGHTQPSLAPWISLGFAGVLVGLYLLAKRKLTRDLGSQALIVTFATIVAFHSIYLELLPIEARPALFILIMLGVAFVPEKAKFKAPNETYWAPAAALLAIMATEYLSICSHLMNADGSAWLEIAFAALISILATIFRTKKLTDLQTMAPLFLGGAHVLALLSLYRLTSSSGSLAVSISWLLYGVGVIIFSFTRKDQIIAKSALFVLAFAAGKALIFDAASAPTVVRIACLMLTGAVLYGCGFFMRKTAAWSKGN